MDAVFPTATDAHREARATTVGVVIRTLNESELIGTCLEVIRGQRSPHSVEVVVVDSGSTDSTVAIAEAHGVPVVHMPPGDFDYSKALNVGIESLAGELVISLSAHAIPLDEAWLDALTAPFQDPRVAGVVSRQLPWPDAPWREVQRLGWMFGEERRAYTSAEAQGLIFSNAASCVRRSVWREQPFTLPAAEDQEWAERVVAAGWTVVYEPAAAVHHSHAESPRAQARRLIDINRVRCEDGARSRHRTLREAAGLLYRDGSAILALKESPWRKAAHLADLLCMVFFYVKDFTSVGTTAERRRRDSSRPL
jgi:glycosyltransferase involved in cell wall biosynthesis